MKNMSIGVVLGLLCAFSVLAESVVWTNDVSETADWRTAANWTDASGQVMSEAPIGNAGQEVSFVRLPSAESSQQINLAARLEAPLSGSEWDWTTCTLPALPAVGNAPLRRTVNVSSYTNSVAEYGVWIVVQDLLAPDFLWKFTQGQIGFSLPSTAQNAIALSHVSPAKRVDVDVPTAGTRATVETVHEGGVLVKRGAGELEVKATSGSDVRFHVAGGTLTLDGRGAAEAGDDVPVPGAWLHLDADRVDTMLGYEGDDGRNYVTNWVDVRGNGNYAWINPAKATADKPIFQAPFLNTTLVPGKTVMDFGRAYADQPEELGPVGCALDLCKTCSNVREVFYVMGRSPRNSGYVYHVPVLGAESGIPFLPGSTMLLATSYMYENPRLYGNMACAAYGDIMMDGERIANDRPNPTTFGVVSIGLTNKVDVSMIAADRRYSASRGGIRLCELIIYTNVLTHAERLAVHRHLQRKWTLRDELEDLDAGSVTFGTDATTALSVPAGRTAKVGEITSMGGTLVKKGDGVLQVGSLAGKMGATTPAIDVQGGSVTFGALATVSSETPATGAYVWLDATKADSFVYEEGRDGMISEWHDCRSDQTDVYAKKPVGQRDYVAGGALPTRVANAVGDKAVVDFGPRATDNATAAFMQIGSLDKAYVYEAFIVQRFTAANATGVNVFGSSSGTALMRGSQTTLLRSTYGNYAGRGALWTVNGAVTDPADTAGVDFSELDFNVISVSASEKVFADLLGGKDRLGQGSYWGGVQVGEFIAYDRKLTPAERRQTIAYLMNRWKGRKPDYAADKLSVSKLTFAADKPAVLEAESDLSVGAVGGSNGAIVKRGSGDVTLEEPLASTMSVTVEKGRLEAKVDKLAEIMAKAAFHFDPTDVDSLTYTVATDGDAVVTNVSNVADQRVAGLSANAWIDNKVTFAEPTLVSVETAPGVVRTVFDFADKDTVKANSSAFVFSSTFNNILEAHTIFSDTTSITTPIFTDVSNYNYLRPGGGAIVSSSSSYDEKTLRVRNGYIGVDNVETPASTKYPSGFHLVSVRPTDVTSISAMATDRKLTAGGCRIGELLGFTEALPAAESGYLRGHLMAKWFGASAPTWTNDVGAVSVTAGAMLAFGASAVVRPVSLSGGGTIEVGRLVASGSISIVAGSPLQVSGIFDQCGPIVVTVDFSKIADRRDVLEYDLVDATSLTNLDIASWSLASPLPRRGMATFCRYGNRVVLKIIPPGMRLIVR